MFYRKDSGLYVLFYTEKSFKIINRIKIILSFDLGICHYVLLAEWFWCRVSHEDVGGDCSYPKAGLGLGELLLTWLSHKAVGGGLSSFPCGSLQRAA